MKVKVIIEWEYNYKSRKSIKDIDILNKIKESLEKVSLDDYTNLEYKEEYPWLSQ